MSFERLVKEMDALTYNSRSVLNALIRSVLRYGTDNGYSVVKNKETLTLTRQHIYLLYRFYNEWAAYDFDGADFDLARSNVVSNFLTPKSEDESLLTEALVIHSKILYMNSDNDGNADSYWINRIINSVDKTMLLNSSPIPINLRTPVLDENMNTTKYNQYETYLLPIGYYRSQILGYYDDGNDYSAGGKTWAFHVNNKFEVDCPTIILGGSSYVAYGGVDRFKNRSQSSRGSSIYSSYNLCYGYNTKVIGDFSTVGGFNNFIINSYASTSASCASMLQGNYSGIFAGYYNQIHSDYSSTSGGEDLTILAPHGHAANQFNTVGYYGMYFDVPDLQAIDTSCVTTVNSCDATDTEEVTSIYNPSNIVRIYTNKNTLTPFAWQKLNVGNLVMIYDQTINSKDYLTWNGIEFKHQVATVTGVEQGDGYYDIILNSNVNYTQYGVNGGKIAKIAENASQTYYYGANSTAFNYASIAAGFNQTVAGIANVPLTTPNFMVGTGYIPSGDNVATNYIDGEYISSKIYRETGFAVARDYFFGAIGSYIEYGALRSGADKTGQHRWVHTSDISTQGDMYFEYAEGCIERASANSAEQNPDLNDYMVYHTNHIGLSNTIMSLGRYTTRREEDNCIGAINFYDKDWFNDHNDVNQDNQPRNTIIEIIAQNGVRELKSNINITNGLMNASGYINNMRYNEAGSYGVWLDNPVANSLYSDSEYIAISAANTLSLYSSNCVLLSSQSHVSIDASYFNISSTTNTLGTLALTGDAKSHAFWFGGADDGDPVRCLFGGFLINSHKNMLARPYILPNGYGTDEFIYGSASDHIFSSVGGNNNIPNYQKDSYGEAVQLHIPGPSYTDNIHPFITRYKKAEYDSDGNETVAEIMKVNKLALLDDIQYQRIWRGRNTGSTRVLYRFADIVLPATSEFACHFSFDVIANSTSGFGYQTSYDLKFMNPNYITYPTTTGTTVYSIVKNLYGLTDSQVEHNTAVKTLLPLLLMRYNTVGNSTTSARIELWTEVLYYGNTYIMKKAIDNESCLIVNTPSSYDNLDASSNYYFFDRNRQNLLPDSDITQFNVIGNETSLTVKQLTEVGWVTD